MPRWKGGHTGPRTEPVRQDALQSLWGDGNRTPHSEKCKPLWRKDASLDLSISLLTADHWLWQPPDETFSSLSHQREACYCAEKLWGLKRRKNIKPESEGSQRTSLPTKSKEREYKRPMISLTVRKKYRLLVCHIINVFPNDYETIMRWTKLELKEVSKEAEQLVTRGKFPCTAKEKAPRRVLSGRVPSVTLHWPELEVPATFTNLLKVIIKQECRPTAVIPEDRFIDFGCFSSNTLLPQQAQEWQTHTTELQNALPITVELL